MKRKAAISSTLEKTRGKKWSKKLQGLTDWRYAAVNDYMHRASHVVVKTCVDNDISFVYVGDVTQSLNHINLGKKTNQNLVFEVKTFVHKNFNLETCLQPAKVDSIAPNFCGLASL